MTVKSKILSLKLFEKQERHPEYAEKIGISVVVKTDTVPDCERTSIDNLSFCSKNIKE